jgi:hypothetical protein
MMFDLQESNASAVAHLLYARLVERANGSVIELAKESQQENDRFRRAVEQTRFAEDMDGVHAEVFLSLGALANALANHGYRRGEGFHDGLLEAALQSLGLEPFVEVRIGANGFELRSWILDTLEGV